VHTGFTLHKCNLYKRMPARGGAVYPLAEEGAISHIEKRYFLRL